MTTADQSESPRVTVFRRQLVIFITLMGGGPMVIWIGGILIFWLFNLSLVRLHWLWAIAGPLQVGALVWWMRSILGMRARVRETGGLLCPRCGYDLRDRADATLCSECGLRVTDDDLAHAWREWKKQYGSQKEKIEAMMASGREAPTPAESDQGS